MNYTILIFLLSLLLVSCKNGKNNEATKEFECPYRELQNEETEGRIENGNFINGEINLALESNLKKLGKGKLGINFKDSSIINSNLKFVKTKIEYDKEFLSKHNSIIQILCAVEKDLQDTTISQSNREDLFEEKMKKREEYFQLLLGKKKETLPIPEKNIPLKIEKVKNSELEKSKSVHNAITNSATDNAQQIYISNRNQYGGTFQVDIHNKEKRPTANEVIYELLDKINPTIRDSIKKDSRNICIMISQPNLIRLMDYKEELSTEKILQIKSNGSVNSGIGNRFSNCINDLDEGYLVGYNIFAMENFKFK